MAVSIQAKDGGRARAAAIAPRVALAAILLGYLALGLAYNVGNPIWEAPDELAHLEHAEYIAETHSLPVRQKSVGDQLHQPPLYYVIGSLIVEVVGPDDQLHGKPNPYFIWRTERIGTEPNVAVHTQDELPPYKGTVLIVHLLRAVSLLFSAVAVWATYAVARRVLPDRPWLAVAAAGLTAFTPQFLFVSATAGNDGPAIALGSLTLLGLVIIAQKVQMGEQVPMRAFALLGLVMGLGLLSKLTYLGLLPVGASVGFYTLIVGRSCWLRLVRGWALCGAVTTLIGGWWYVRNYLIYANIYEILGEGRADWRVALDPVEKPDQMAKIFAWYPEPLFQSFWLRFGWMNITPEGWVYDAAVVLSALAAIGCLLFVAQQVLGRDRIPKSSTLGLIICGFAFLSVFGIIAYRFAYTIGNHYPQGRYLYPAQPGTALLLVLGLSALTGLPLKIIDRLAGDTSPWRRTKWVLTVVAAVALPLVLAGFSYQALDRYIVQTYQYLPVWQHFDTGRLPHEIQADYAGKLSLIGYDLQGKELTTGGEAILDLYWRAEDKMEQDYHSFVHVADESGKPGPQKDAPAGGSIYPTSRWEPGEVIVERRVIPIDRTVPEGSYQVLVGVYSLDTMERLPLLEPAGATAVRLDTVTIRAVGEASTGSDANPPS